MAGQALIDGTLRDIAVELAALLAQQEIKVYLTIIVGHHALWLVAEHAGTKAKEERQHVSPEAHCGIPGAALTEDDGEIDEEEPHVLREAIKHAAHKGFLARQTCHLSVSGVAEVTEHQQQHTNKVVRKVGEVEHTACRRAEENGEDGDGIGMDAHLHPHEGKDQTDGTGEMYVKPLLGVV